RPGDHSAGDSDASFAFAFAFARGGLVPSGSSVGPRSKRSFSSLIVPSAQIRSRYFMSASVLGHAVEFPHKTIDERRHIRTTQSSENFLRISKIPAQRRAIRSWRLGRAQLIVRTAIRDKSVPKPR